MDWPFIYILFWIQNWYARAYGDSGTYGLWCVNLPRSHTPSTWGSCQPWKGSSEAQPRPWRSRRLSKGDCCLPFSERSLPSLDSSQHPLTHRLGGALLKHWDNANSSPFLSPWPLKWAECSGKRQRWCSWKSLGFLVLVFFSCFRSYCLAHPVAICWQRVKWKAITESHPLRGGIHGFFK